MTWTDTIFHSDILTFGPRLALHQEGEMSVSPNPVTNKRSAALDVGVRATSLRCMSQLLAQSRHELAHCTAFGGKADMTFCSAYVCF
jgi:hypothetical protein